MLDSILQKTNDLANHIYNSHQTNKFIENIFGLVLLFVLDILDYTPSSIINESNFETFSKSLRQMAVNILSLWLNLPANKDEFIEKWKIFFEEWNKFSVKSKSLLTNLHLNKYPLN